MILDISGGRHILHQAIDEGLTAKPVKYASAPQLVAKGNVVNGFVRREHRDKDFEGGFVPKIVEIVGFEDTDSGGKSILRHEASTEYSAFGFGTMEAVNLPIITSHLQPPGS